MEAIKNSSNFKVFLKRLIPSVTLFIGSFLFVCLCTYLVSLSEDDITLCMGTMWHILILTVGIYFLVLRYFLPYY